MARKVKAKPAAKEYTERERTLDTARSAVLGDRQLNYGSPEDNFERIKLLWNAWLKGRIKPLEETGFSQHDVSILLIFLKAARLSHTPDHFESWADIAGYAACGAETSKNAGV